MSPVGTLSPRQQRRRNFIVLLRFVRVSLAESKTLKVQRAANLRFEPRNKSRMIWLAEGS